MSLLFANDFPDTIYVSLVFGQRASSGYSWWKAGWWAIPNGQSVETISGSLSQEIAPFIYVNAQTADDATYWAGPLQVEVTNNAFSQPFSDNAGDTRTVGFREIDIGGYDNFTLTFVGIPEWPQAQHDVRRSGLTTADLSGNAGNTAWSLSLPAGVGTILVGEDQTIYVSGVSTLYAVNPVGTIRWTATLPGVSEGISYPLASADDGTIYACSADTIVAIAPDGTERWRTSFTVGASAALAVGSDGTIYAMGQPSAPPGSAGPETGVLVALGSHGNEKWSFEYAARSGSATTPAIGSDGTIYFGGDFAYAVNPNGRQKWAYPTPYNLGSPAIGADGTIYFPSGVSGNHGQLLAFAPDGTIKWVFEGTAGGFPWQSPAVANDGTIYQSGMPNAYTDPTPNPNVTIALDPSGNLLWGWEMGGGVPILGADGTICLWGWDAHSGPAFTALRPDGIVRWSVAGSFLVDAGEAIADDGTIYIGYAGALYALQ